LLKRSDPARRRQASGLILRISQQSTRGMTQMGVKIEELASYTTWLDEDSRPISEDKVRGFEEHFIGLVNDIKEEIMSKKKFNEELMTRVVRRSTLVLNQSWSTRKG
jgi:hypothetical protein